VEKGQTFGAEHRLSIEAAIKTGLRE
jgi:hypothetical protein